MARVRDDELSGPTPCPAYTLGDLVEHVGVLALAFRAAAEKDIASPYVNQTPAGDAAKLPADWRERIPADLAALAQAWAKPDAWTGMTRIAQQEAPAEAGTRPGRPADPAPGPVVPANLLTRSAGTLGIGHFRRAWSYLRSGD